MENIEKNTALSNFQKLLLNGPIMTNEGFKEVIKTRKQINRRLGHTQEYKYATVEDALEQKRRRFYSESKVYFLI